MSGDPGQVEVAADSQLETGNSQPRAAGKGPFILAKVIVSYLAKKKQVRLRLIITVGFLSIATAC